MNKTFLFRKHTETSEDCDKFSKSVSYETLVGETPTAGSAYKQAQCFGKGGAKTPLTAVGTFSAAPRAASKVVEKSLHRHPKPQTKNPEKTKTVIPDLIGHLSRIKKEVAEVAFGAASQAPCLGSRLSSCPRMTGRALSSRGAAGDVAISCGKVLSFLSRCCASANQGISAPASCREAHKRRFLFNSKIPGIFRLTAKNRDDSFFVASPHGSLHRHSEPQAKNPVKHTFQDWILHLASAQFRMTILTLTLAVILAMGIISESWAVTCEFTADTTPGNEGKYTLEVKGDAGGSAFTTSSCTNIPNGQSWTKIRSKITSASFNSNVTSIGNGAFYNASSLQSVNMPNVTSIGQEAFQYASSLQSVDMPNVTTIGKKAFQNATSLTSVSMPNATTIGNIAFGSTALTSIDMPNVTTLENSAFSNATSLTSVSMPNVTTIGDGVFYGLSSLESITISDAANSMGYFALWNTNFTDINCIEDPSTVNTCEQVKALMKQARASFSDDYFYTVTEPTANCDGYSHGVCTTCASGYTMADNVCAINCTEDEYRQGNGCVSKSVGCSSGYLNKDNTECIEPSACGGEYIADEANGVCKKIPGCMDFANGACGGCESGYYKKDGGCVAATDGCGDGYLKKGTSCISAAQGCGSSFRLNDGECDRIRYTPAEAAEVLKDTDNEIIMTFKVNR